MDGYCSRCMHVTLVRSVAANIYARIHNAFAVPKAVKICIRRRINFQTEFHLFFKLLS